MPAPKALVAGKMVVEPQKASWPIRRLPEIVLELMVRFPELLIAPARLSETVLLLRVRLPSFKMARLFPETLQSVTLNDPRLLIATVLPETVLSLRLTAPRLAKGYSEPMSVRPET